MFFKKLQTCLLTVLFIPITFLSAQDLSENQFVGDLRNELPASENSRSQTIQYAGIAAELTLSRISDRTIEVQIAPIEGEAPASLPTSDILVDYSSEELWSGRQIEKSVERNIGEFNIEITHSPLSIVIKKEDGTLIQKLSWPGDDGSMQFQTKSPVFGLGHGGPQYDRRGHTYPWQDGWGAYKRPTHGSRVFAPMLIGSDGWSMFVQHPISETNEFDLRYGQGFFHPDEEVLDQPVKLILTVWDEPAQVMNEYTKYAGQSPMPPQWSLGYMQSHRTLEGPEQLTEIARTFREKKLPADAVIYLGSGFVPSGWNEGHGSFEFNSEVFDKPKQIIDDLHNLNFKTVLHTYGAPDGLHGNSVTNSSTSDSSHISNLWSLHQPISELGVDGWWPDGAEHLSTESRLARHRMYWLGQLSDYPNERPWSLHRTGYSGVHKYGSWVWSGDPESFWKTLETHIAVGLNHSISLTPFWGSDTGGFRPTEQFTGDLYIRWFQFSAFTASFRGHGRAWQLRLPWGWNRADTGPPELTETGGWDEVYEKGYPRIEELRNGLVEPIAREYLQLRYRLLPYNYTLLRETHDTGLPPMRAMWLHYPNDGKTTTLDDQYMWGRDMLIAPVYVKGAENRTLYLPKGQWYDFWTNEITEGNQEITRQVDLATMPIYIRAGAILPLDPVRQYVDEPVDGPTTLHIYPGQDGEFELYDDDGRTLDHQDGEYSKTLLNWDDEGRILTIEPSEGEPLERQFRIELVGEDDQEEIVDYQGEQIQVQFD